MCLYNIMLVFAYTIISVLFDFIFVLTIIILYTYKIINIIIIKFYRPTIYAEVLYLKISLTTHIQIKVKNSIFLNVIKKISYSHVLSPSYAHIRYSKCSLISFNFQNSSK